MRARARSWNPYGVTITLPPTQLRKTRPHPRPKSLGARKLTLREMEEGRRLRRLPLVARPKTRADCENVQRPCPWVSCRYHLYLDVNHDTRALKLNFPHLTPDQMPPNESCALDVADRGGVTLEETGRLANVTLERARQLEEMALRELRAKVEGHADEDEHGENT